MVKDLINKIIGSRVFCAVAAILIALCVWLYVTSVENPSIEDTISGIPVTFVGADDVLADRSLMVKNSRDVTVTLKVMGKRSQIAALNNDNITITVDMKDIKATGEFEKLYNITFPNGLTSDDIYVLDKSPAAVSLTIDRVIDKSVPVEAVHKGNVAEGFMSESIECEPEFIKISGPEEIVKTVAKARVELDRENVDKTIDVDLPYELLDADGKTVESKEITADTETVNVVLPIITVKDVPITVEYVAGGGASKDDVVTDLSIKYITLAGDAAVLNELNSITVGPIDLASFSATNTVTLQIPIPNGLQNLTGVTEVTVKSEIKGLEVTQLSATNIKTINEPSGYYATLITQSLDIKVRAPGEIIDLINSTNIRIVADLSTLGNGAGRYTVPAKVSIDGYSDAGVVGDYKIVVSLSSEPPEEELPAETPNGN